MVMTIQLAPYGENISPVYEEVCRSLETLLWDKLSEKTKEHGFTDWDLDECDKTGARIVMYKDDMLCTDPSSQLDALAAEMSVVLDEHNKSIKGNAAYLAERNESEKSQIISNAIAGLRSRNLGSLHSQLEDAVEKAVEKCFKVDIEKRVDEDKELAALVKKKMKKAGFTVSDIRWERLDFNDTFVLHIISESNASSAPFRRICLATQALSDLPEDVLAKIFRISVMTKEEYYAVEDAAAFRRIFELL